MIDLKAIQRNVLSKTKCDRLLTKNNLHTKFFQQFCEKECSFLFATGDLVTREIMSHLSLLNGLTLHLQPLTPLFVLLLLYFSHFLEEKEKTQQVQSLQCF